MKNKPLVLILCGGQSLRLWPLSQYRSKNFLDIFGFSPLEVTLKRFLKITTSDRIFLVANRGEKAKLAKIKLIKKRNIFFEPESKNTAAAILLSLLNLKKYSAENIIISPVDHFIKKEKQLYIALQKSLQAARQGYICTLGIKPTMSMPNLGYIQTEGKAKAGVYPVKKFIEKPSLARAGKLIRKGNCFYNSGMFIASIYTLFDEYRKYYSEFDGFARAYSQRTIVSFYKKIKNIPFDKVIMEKTKKVRLIRANFFWKDFGNWLTVYEILKADNDGNVKRGNVNIIEGKNNFIYLDDPGKKLLAIGVKDVFFIDTKDYSLLTTRANIDKLKTALRKVK